MKILFVVSYGDIAAGAGSSVAVMNLMDSLLNIKGVELHVVYQCSTEGTLTQWMARRNVPFTSIYGVDRYVWPKVNGLKSIAVFPLQLAIKRIYHVISVHQIRRVIREVKPDIVHVNNSILYCGISAADKEHVPSLWHIREYADFDFDLFPSKRIFAQRMRQHYTVAISKDISNHFGLVEPEKHFVVFDGVMKECQTAYVPEKKDYFLFVGSVTKNKGVSDMLAAFSIYVKRHTVGELWIAGNYKRDYYNEICKFIEESGIKERVKFLGFRNDRYELMKNARALIVPSLFEGFGFITVEGIMNGTIVIGKNVSGTKMIFDEMPDCEFPYLTIEEMANHMETVMAAAPDSFYKRIIRAQELAKKKFSIERYGAEINEIYRIIVKKQGVNYEKE